MCEVDDGPEVVLFVCGSESDAAYWQARARLTSSDVFRANGTTRIDSLAERQRLGSFLGTLNAWSRMRAQSLPEIALMSMVFGEGRRLSPFTQALQNRKAAFTTPRLGKRSGVFLNAAEVANLYTNSWFNHLRERGFRGVLVKWGDEAILPSASQPEAARRLADVDVVRFVWHARPTIVLATQKDWFLVDRGSGLVVDVLPRQPLASLLAVLSHDPAVEAAVNLGSLALTREFLDAALAVFRDEVERGLALDWDPHLFVALLASSQAAFFEYCEQQAAAGRPFSPPPGMSELQFFAKAQELRSLVRRATGRELRIGTLDFGEALWLDFGLQTTLGEIFTSLPQRTSRGELLRQAFGVPEERDGDGNILVESKLPAGARIEGSIFLRSAIEDPASRVSGAVFVNSTVTAATARQGGAVVDSDLRRLELSGAGAVAFKVTAESLALGERGRAVSIPINGTPRIFRASETECNDPRLFAATLNDNPMSFLELSQTVAHDGSKNARR
ncbi:MAG: hypothetical protein JOZ15_10995 [Acidobacteria bacterium]|nr:hypothetical protein [Acidobacteriota bacterium]